MKLTSLNLQGFTDWEQRKPEIVDYLQAESPDVVLFQEVVFIPEVSPYNQAQILNEDLKYTYENSAVTRLQPSPNYKVYREGLAALSKHPMTKVDTLVLDQELDDEHNRIIQLIDINLGDRAIKLANVHFSLADTTDFATPHLKETLAILDMRGEERIIAGDFNMAQLDTAADELKDKYEASTITPYISFPTMDKRIDYFLLPKPYSFVDITTSSDGLSDHRALTVNIDINKIK
jgi:endonuclease/exonuclease/phosphatase family metal-dependent hydrolase